MLYFETVLRKLKFMKKYEICKKNQNFCKLQFVIFRNHQIHLREFHY